MTRRVGWTQEPWRHGLAAKGIKTRSYMSTKSNRYFQELMPISATTVKQGEVKPSGQINIIRQGPKERSERPQTFATQEKEARAEARLAEFRSQQQKKGGLTETALSRIRDGQTSVQLSDGRSATVAFFIQNEKSLSPGERARLIAAVNEQSILLAQAEQPVPAEYQGVLTNTTRAQLKAIQEQQKIASRTPAQQAVADVGKGALIGASEAAEAGGSAVVAAPGELAGTAREGLQESPKGGAGLFGGGGVPTLGSAPASAAGGRQRSTGEGQSLFSDNPLLGGPNVALGGGNAALGTATTKVDTFPEAKIAQKEVDEFYGAKDRLKKVDLSGYKEGKKAFDKGDRESLIRSINALEAEELKLRDRWHMVEQTRSVLLNPRTRAATLRQQDGMFSSGLFGASGGSALADQTEKLNAVKREIKDSSNEAYARRVTLQNDLRRLDAKVMPVTEAPKDVQVLSDDKKDSKFDKFKFWRKS